MLYPLSYGRYREPEPIGGRLPTQNLLIALSDFQHFINISDLDRGPIFKAFT
jgi:hypothetical protein